MITKDEIFTILKTIYDPELGHNIVDLGLIYNVEISPDSTRNTQHVTLITITMTLTSPGCPLAPYFIDQVKTTVAIAANCPEDHVVVNITFDPPWSAEAVSEEIRLQLGL